MKKLSTLFKKDPNDLGRVVNEVSPENEWVFTDGIPTRKYDGTACAIINGELYRRYDAKYGKKAPLNAIPCQEPDLITGHHPHWIKCERINKQDCYHFEAFDLLENKEDGTYELIGEKLQGNPEKISGHILLKHGEHILNGLVYPLTFENLKKYLEQVNIEGIVFHAKDGKMCKLRKSDFGIKRV
jgi:hypothetical protein